MNVNIANVFVLTFVSQTLNSQMAIELCFLSKRVDANGLCLPPVWSVTLVGHGTVRLQEQNFMQFQNESVNISNSKETPHPSPLCFRQLLLELCRKVLKRVLKM